jgi:acetylxylan esterase
MDNALCGGGDLNQGYTNTSPLITSAASNAIKAIIWAGDPRHTSGSPYNYGTSNAGGFDARPAGYTCATYVSALRLFWKERRGAIANMMRLDVENSLVL